MGTMHTGATRFFSALCVLLNSATLAYDSQSSSSGTFFQVSTGVEEYDRAYRVALQELGGNRDTKREVYVAGSGWGGLWTRDSAYAIELAAGLIDPAFSAKTLFKCTETFRLGGRKNTPSVRLLANISLEPLMEQTAKDEAAPFAWLQDKCGHFGGWPALSDAIVGAQGAWALYLVQGDKDFLKRAFAFTLAALHRAEVSVYDGSFTGLFKGCSSFMESNGGYPQRFASSGRLVAETKALSTNMLYYNGYRLGSKMAQELGEQEASDILLQKAKVLRDSIRNHLWLSKDDKGVGGYYSYVMDENNELLPQMEGLGESFVLLAEDFEDDETRIDSMFENIPRTPKGIACLWPQFEHNWTNAYGLDKVFSRYHNGRIWPFVQGYWAMAAAKHRRMDIFAEELQNLMRLSQVKFQRLISDLNTALDGKSYKIPDNLTDTFAEFYELDGKFLWSQRSQLWSDAGYLSMFFYGIFGLRFETNGIRFEPMKPLALFPRDNPISLRGIHYRKMTLDVVLHGSGTEMMSASVNGETAALPLFVEATLTGHHVLEIQLDDSNDEVTTKGPINDKDRNTELQTKQYEATNADDGESVLSEAPSAVSDTSASLPLDPAFQEFVERLGMSDFAYSKEYKLLPLLVWSALALLFCRILISRRRVHIKKGLHERINEGGDA